MQYAKGYGAPQAEIGPWRTRRGLLMASTGGPCAAIWRIGAVKGQEIAGQARDEEVRDGGSLPRRAGQRVRARGASSGGPQNKKGDLTGWSILLSAVRTRLENQLEHPMQSVAGMLSIAYLCG